MTPTPHIIPLRDLTYGVGELRAEAAEEGFTFVDRLLHDWHSGMNRFDRPGEVLLAAFDLADLVAVGGLNQNPYADQVGVGRLRHIYVIRRARRSGVGSSLVGQLIHHANGTFDKIRLRTKTREAADFYVSLGLSPVQEEAATHVKILR